MNEGCQKVEKDVGMPMEICLPAAKIFKKPGKMICEALIFILKN
jgi:hypothetical protein